MFKLHPHFHTIMAKKKKELTHPEHKFQLMFPEGDSGPDPAIVVVVTFKQRRISKEIIREREGHQITRLYQTSSNTSLNLSRKNTPVLFVDRQNCKRNMRDTTSFETRTLKRTRQSSRSNSGCSSEDETATSNGYGVLHKRSRLELNNIAGSSSLNNHQPQDPLTPSLKLKDPTRIYNFGYRKKPAELFRKDLISAMKLADSEQLNDSDYIAITDHWKEEWEKGVQVPVNPEALPSASFRCLSSTKTPKLITKHSSETFPHHIKPKPRSHSEGGIKLNHNNKLPKEYIKGNRTSSEYHKYELDLIDISWREMMSQTCLPPIPESLIEDVITELERQCAENMKNNKIGIEFNDGVVCDVCRSPYSEDGNEMVFCDTCNVCVHQACYDIEEIPSGEWYCQPCRELGRVDKASCILCPNKNGAMKRNPDDKWAHVSCSLWVVSQIDGDHKDNSLDVKVKKTSNTKHRTRAL